MPKIVDHQQRQQELAESAFLTVVNLGFSKTTMRSLAETAGCSTGTLVHYFHDKDDILSAALNYAHDRTGRRMRKIIQDDPPKLVYKIVKEALPVGAEQRQEWKVWTEFWGTINEKPELKKLNRQRYKEWLGGLQRVLQRGVDLGEFNTRLNINDEVNVIAALIDGIGLQATLDPQRLPAQAQIKIINRYLDSLLT